MFSVYLSYKYYLMELICCECTRIQSSLGILTHSPLLRLQSRLLKLAGLTQLSRPTPNLLDTWKTKKSLLNLDQSWERLRPAIGGIDTTCRHHQGLNQLLKQKRLTVARDTQTANVGMGGQRRRLRIRDGPERVNRVNSFVTGGRTLSSSPLLYKRRRKLLSSCFSNFAEAATSNLFGDFS